MSREDYERKLREWEAQGYDVSELRQKWFPAKKAKGKSHKYRWLAIALSITIVAVGIVIWQPWSGAPEATPAPAAPAPAPTAKPTAVPAPAPAPTQTPTPAPVNYSLTTLLNPSNDSGRVSLYPNGGTYKSDTEVTLTAEPAPCYKFDHWSGTDDDYANPTTLTMNSNKSIVANFSRIRYSLTTLVNPPSSGSVSPSSGTYDSGTVVTLTATPLSGYQFERWSEDATGTSEKITITMDSDMGLVANFVAKDTDGDGLTDEEERQIGTNPSYADTDHDGLSDYEEVKDKKTDPLSPDTDGDGVRDGDDLFPFYDAYVKVAIKYFEDTSEKGVYIDGGIFYSYGEPYFKVWGDNELKISTTPDELNVFSLQNPYLALFNVADNRQFVTIRIEVWDKDSLSNDDQYDAGSAAGTDPDTFAYKKQFNILGGAVTETSDGAADGSLQGPQAKIIVEISIVPHQ